MKLDPNAKVESFVSTEGPGPDTHRTVVPSGPAVEVDGLSPAQQQMLEDSLHPGWWTSPRAKFLLLDHATTVGYGPEFYQVELNKIRCGTVRGQAAHARFTAEERIFKMVEKKNAGTWTVSDQEKYERWVLAARLWFVNWAERVVNEGKSVEKVFEDSLIDFSGNSYEVKLAAMKELGLVELLNLNGVRI
jgi:hypothetical protein